MTVSGAESPAFPGRGPSRHETVDEQARRRGVHPVTSVGDMARDDVFETDEELDAFLVHVYAERHANLT